MDIKELELVNPDKHWYYQSKLSALKRVVSKISLMGTIIDVGAGSGFFGLNIGNSRDVKNVLFIDPEYKDVIPSKLKSYKTYSSCPHTPGDLYLLIDVLEHVDDDSEILSHYVKEANPSARFLITVPAFMSLWSPHDDFLEHKRRYSRADLTSVANSAGLTILESKYLFSCITPLVYLIRKVKSRFKSTGSDMRETQRAANLILKALCNIEHKLTSNKFFGLSVLVLAQKKPNS